MPPATVDCRGHVMPTPSSPSARKGRRYPAEVLDRTEVELLIADRSRRAPSGIRDRALIAILYGSGLRISEALDLQIKDVNLNDPTIRVLSGKGSKARTVVLEPQAAAMIELWLAQRAKIGIPSRAPLFCTISKDAGPWARRMNDSAVREMLKRAARRAGITKRVHPHGFRHTHAYELLRGGVPIDAIQVQLGHNSIATTAHYMGHLAGATASPELRAWRAPGLTPHDD